MFGSDSFQLVYGETIHIGTLAVSGAYPKYTAIDDRGDNINGDPAEGEAIGFLSQDVTLVGPTFEQMSLNFRDLPVKSGNKSTLECPDVGAQIEVENEPSKAFNSADGLKRIVTTGTGALTAGTAKDTEVSFKNGRFYAAQTGDRVWGRVLNAAVTPFVTANIRIRIERVAGYTL